MKAKIETFEDLVELGEKIAQVIGQRPVEVNITLGEDEYKRYINNYDNSFEAYLDKNPMLPLFKSPLNNSGKLEVMKSFLHRSGVKITICSFFQG